MSTKTRKVYCVVYRTGGTENFKWHRTAATMDRDEANRMCGDTRRMGYKAFVDDYNKSVAIGLPETYEYGDELTTADIREQQKQQMGM